MPATRPSFALLSLASNLERHKLASGEPWLLLLDLEWPGDVDPNATQQHVRLVRDLDERVFDAQDGQGPQTYVPFNFEMGDVTVTGNGSVPETEIKASNVLRSLQTTIEQFGGVVGANVFLYVVNAANPAGEAELSLAFTVKQTVCDPKQVTFRLGAPNPLRRNFPLHMYRPNFCMWTYKGVQCGYAGPMPTCSHTIEGETGCKAHDNLVRIGTFPGIDTNGAAVASAS